MERLEALRRQVEDRRRQNVWKLQLALEESVEAMASTVETRDPHIARHQQRVAELACAIGQEMGLPEEQIEGVRIAGLIHDIGKLYIPAEFLNKSTRLSESEFASIKEHCRIGYEILKRINFARPVSQIVLQHHERIDGSGYPSGIQGDEILIDSRILAVADVVEAMVADRPYQPRLEIDEALDEIRENGAVLYDSEAVDACTKLFATRKFTFMN